MVSFVFIYIYIYIFDLYLMVGGGGSSSNASAPPGMFASTPSSASISPTKRHVESSSSINLKLVLDADDIGK